MGTLYVVATPIGNLEDVTLRALRVMREASCLLAEDTRRTRVLLQRHGIDARPRSLHAHNEVARTDEVLALLRAGRDVALVSDAGTPLVSDPGARLVAASVADGHLVCSIPGPSAVLAALTASGFPADAFTFLGFLPRRASARAALLARERGTAHPIVLFESPRRTGSTLAALREALGERRACVARELTKLHEEIARGALGELAQRFAGGARGEVTIVVEGASHAARTLAASPNRESTDRAHEYPTLDAGALDDEIRAGLARGEHARDLAASLASRSGRPRREIYARAVVLRGRT